MLDAVLHHGRVRPNAPALRARVAGSWRPTSWSQWHQAAREIAAGLAARGLRSGDRVAVLGREGITALAVDLGITALGAIAIPLPLGAPPPEIGAILRDAQVACLFVEPELAARLVGLGEVAPRVIELPPPDGDAAGGMVAALRDEGRAALALRGEIAAALDAVPEHLRPSDPWSILYTSGTTGAPRGIVLSHGAAVYQGRALAEASAFTPSDEQLLALPTSQVFGRMALQAGIAAGTTTALGSVRNFDRDLVEVGPVCFSAVPEALERMAWRWREALEAGGWARPALDRALEVGRRVSALQQRGEAIPMTLGVQHRLAERMLLARMRARLGGRLRFIGCGGAALRRELAEFFHAFGVLVLEGYGLTEAGGVVSWNRPDRFRFGTVGQLLPGCEAHVAEDGELCVRSPSLGRPLRHDGGQPSIDAEGFLHTGDVVEIQQGFVRLVGRKRDILKTTGGKLIAPQKIEQRLRGHAGIARAVVLGEGRARPVVLVDIDDAAMGELAADLDLGCRSRTDLVEHPRIRAHVADAIAAVNATLARHETITEFAMLAEPLRASAGELTAAGAIRRQVVAARHGALVEPGSLHLLAVAGPAAGARGSQSLLGVPPFELPWSGPHATRKGPGSSS